MSLHPIQILHVFRGALQILYLDLLDHLELVTLLLLVYRNSQILIRLNTHRFQFRVLSPAKQLLRF